MYGWNDQKTLFVHSLLSKSSILLSSYDLCSYALMHFFYKIVIFLLNIPAMFGIIQTAIEMAED